MAANFKTCLVEGCNRNAHSSARGCSGYCTSHYQRWKAHGDPTAGRVPDNSRRPFIMAATAYDGDDCLEWPFGLLHNGYPQGPRMFGTTRAHRVVCYLVYGRPPAPNYEAAHACGNRRCINPKHLRWETHAENIADRTKHGTVARGEKSGRGKLTEQDVRRIRDWRSRDAISGADLARHFGVTEACISAIHKRKSWTWLE